MKKRFLSLFCVLALCLGLLPTTALAEVVVVPSPGGGDGDISVDVNPDEPGNVTVIIPGQDGGDVVVVIPPEEEEEEAPVIGDVVEAGVTKMKKNLNYEVLVDCMHQNSQGLMEYREQVVVFRKDDINHIARLITYVDIKKGKQPKLITLLNPPAV